MLDAAIQRDTQPIKSSLYIQILRFPEISDPEQPLALLYCDDILYYFDTSVAQGRMRFGTEIQIIDGERFQLFRELVIICVVYTITSFLRLQYTTDESQQP